MKRAFTLIELLVVIAIIGLLSSIVLTSLNAARAKADDGKRVSDLREVQKAVETYANDHGGSYPSTGGSWRSQCSTAGSYAPQNIAPGLVPTYISQFPSDPKMNATAGTCCYYYVSDGKDYDMLIHNCAVANTGNSALSSLKDPVFTSEWSVHTQGAQSNGW